MGAFLPKTDMNVSRETLDKLQEYQALLLKWQQKINLISPNTVNQAWDRHFVDSMQIFEHLPSLNGHLVDLGSGAGFPGLVLAIMGFEHVTLIESDRRKCIFLKEVARDLNLSNVTVITDRLENVHDIKADIVTARALASLEQLIKWTTPFLKPETVLIFPKGRRYDEEISEAGLPDSVKVQIFDSVTDEEAKIVFLSGLSLNSSE